MKIDDVTRALLTEARRMVIDGGFPTPVARAGWLARCTGILMDREPTPRKMPVGNCGVCSKPYPTWEDVRAYRFEGGEGLCWARSRECSRPLRTNSASDEALHPNGRCTCAGEGRCAWCRSMDQDTGAPLSGSHSSSQTVRTAPPEPVRAAAAILEAAPCANYARPVSSGKHGARSAVAGLSADVAPDREENRGNSTRPTRYVATCLHGCDLFAGEDRAATVRFIRNSKARCHCGEPVSPDMTIDAMGSRTHEFIGHVGCECCEQDALPEPAGCAGKETDRG